MKRIIRLLMILLLSKSAKAQLTPLDTIYPNTIPGDSVLVIVDSMIVTKYQVYIDNFNYFRSYPNRPTIMQAFIKGYENVDSISVQSIIKNIEVLINDASFEPFAWWLVVLKPGNRIKSFIKSFNSSNVVSDTKILTMIEPGDILVVTGVVAYDNKSMYDLPARLYKVVNDFPRENSF